MTWGEMVLGALAWVHGEPLGDPRGGRGGGATAPRQLLPGQSSLLGQEAVAMLSYALSVGGVLVPRCVGVRVCVCKNIPEGECSCSHEAIEAGWP